MKLFGFFNIADPWTLDNWRATLNDPVLFRSLWNTLAIGLGSGVIGVLFYALIAYMIVKTRYRGPLAARFSFLAAVVDPGILLGVALLWTFLQTKIFLPIYGTIYLLMVAMVIKSMPFGTQMIKSVLIQLGNDLEEASKVCGGTWLRYLSAGHFSIDHAGADHRRSGGVYLSGEGYQHGRSARLWKIANVVAADARLRRRRGV